MNYWIMKSEPEVFSIGDLEKKGRATWDGVRNYQVRNMMRDEMEKGDMAYFYHSSCEQIGIAGIMSIISKAKPDITFKDKGKNNPWLAVDVEFIARFPHLITRADMQATPTLKNLKILQKGCRLSITQVTKKEFEIIQSLSFSL